ncbi:MAG: NfeD family protein [Synergistaceae bacterium]|nr:NfeD family protein [Synergistaceae bacterium]
MDSLYQLVDEVWKLWLVAGIVFMLIEGLTPGIFSFFFVGLGAFATALICYYHSATAENITQQLLIFSAMSLLSLLLLRPRVLRFIHRNEIQLDGPGMFIGKRAKALTNLQNNGIETGKVQFEGTEWSAFPIEGSPDIPPGSIVEVVRVEGLVLHVRLVQNK